MKKLSFTLSTLICYCSLALGQEAITTPFDSPSWNSEQAEMIPVTFQGEEGILLSEGTIFLDDVEFLNGTIEVDINFSNRRNFPGVRFRMQDQENFENFYIRPHQSGQPDANQYTPVFNGTAGWQLYYGEDWATPVTYEYGQWHHIKIEVSGDRADIYFGDMEKAILEVDLLREAAPGKIGIGTGIAPVYFANFKYTLGDRDLSSKEAGYEIDAETITSWEVSDLIADSLIAHKHQLDRAFKSGLQWTKRNSESGGWINLARYASRSQGKNTVAVKVNIRAAAQQVKRLDFGFSDKVRVFLNDEALFEGRDRFRSRDHRFLGTIGYFDTVFLPLKKGDNELIFVVSEAFGGWALQARFENLEDIGINQ